MPLALVGAGDPHGENRQPTEGVREARRGGGRNPAVPEPRAGADDSGPDGTDDGFVPGPRRPGEGGRGVHALDVPAETRTLRDRGGEQATLAQRANRVREPEWKRAALELEVRDTQAFAQPRTGGRKLA